METKVCSKCGKELPATTEYFRKVKNRNKYTLRGMCKGCEKEYNESRSAKQAEWRKENEKHLQEYMKKNYAENKPNILNRNKQYYENNKDKVLAKCKEYKEKNKEKYFKYGKMWRQNNGCKVAQYSHKRRNKQYELPSTLTKKQWDEIYKHFNGGCAYCGSNDKLEKEHFIPVSKGGGFTQKNVITSCRRCNASKKDRDFFEWYPKQDFYSKERETAILEFLDLAKEEAI